MNAPAKLAGASTSSLITLAVTAVGVTSCPM